MRGLEKKLLGNTSGQNTDLKEGGKDIGIAPGQQQEGQEGAEATVEDRRAHVGQGVHGPGLAIVALEAEEVDGDVRGVVESEADAEDEDDGGHDLDGQAHEVGEAADVGHAEGHGREDKNAGLEIEPTNKI